MTDEEAEEYRKRLTQIKIDLKGKQNRDQRIGELLSLAMEVGASTGKQRLADGGVDAVGLVDNIHMALQTVTMINMSRSSAKMCEITSRNYKIALVAAGAALLSAFAAWVAVLAG